MLVGLYGCKLTGWTAWVAPVVNRSLNIVIWQHHLFCYWLHAVDISHFRKLGLLLQSNAMTKRNKLCVHHHSKTLKLLGRFSTGCWADRFEDDKTLGMWIFSQYKKLYTCFRWSNFSKFWAGWPSFMRTVSTRKRVSWQTVVLGRQEKTTGVENIRLQ